MEVKTKNELPFDFPCPPRLHPPSSILHLPPSTLPFPSPFQPIPACSSGVSFRPISALDHDFGLWPSDFGLPPPSQLSRIQHQSCWIVPDRGWGGRSTTGAGRKSSSSSSSICFRGGGRGRERQWNDSMNVFYKKHVRRSRAQGANLCLFTFPSILYLSAGL